MNVTATEENGCLCPDSTSGAIQIFTTYLITRENGGIQPMPNSFNWPFNISNLYANNVILNTTQLSNFYNILMCEGPTNGPMLLQNFYINVKYKRKQILKLNKYKKFTKGIKT
jgi:hypothetical protein